VNTPGVNAPGVNTPGVNAPGVNTPGVNAPGVNAPGVNAPGGRLLGGEWVRRRHLESGFHAIGQHTSRKACNIKEITKKGDFLRLLHVKASKQPQD
jgi:hypothetical protein